MPLPHPARQPLSAPPARPADPAPAATLARP